MAIIPRSVGLVFVCSAATISSTASAGDKVTKIVKVEDKTFKVQTQDGAVRVVDKAIITRMSMQLRDKMRSAVTKATGCQITDELIEGNALRGKLACTSEPEVDR